MAGRQTDSGFVIETGTYGRQLPGEFVKEALAGGGVSLTVANAASATAASSFAITQAHALAVAGASAATALSTPAVSQGHVLAVAAAQSATALSTVAITAGGTNLTVDASVSATSLSTPAMTQGQQLAVAASSTATALSTPALTQGHALAVAAAQSVTELSTVAITTGSSVSLTVADLASATTLSAVVIAVVDQPAPVSLGGSRNRWDWSWQDFAAAEDAKRAVQLGVAPAASHCALSPVRLSPVRAVHQMQPASAQSAALLSTVTLGQWRKERGLYRSVAPRTLRRK